MTSCCHGAECTKTTTCCQPRASTIAAGVVRPSRTAAGGVRPSRTAAGGVRPSRTAAGEAFTDFIVQVAGFGGFITAAGEALARTGGQSLARWVILDAIEDGPATVAQIARRRGIARQAVQRVANLLVSDGLAAYEPNPDHRRAKLLRPTARGRKALRAISEAQKPWADGLGAEIGGPKLRQAIALVTEVQRAVAARGLPGKRAAPAAHREIGRDVARGRARSRCRGAP
jgi:DNA-binding MarR family transcriptional regulator